MRPCIKIQHAKAAFPIPVWSLRAPPGVAFVLLPGDCHHYVWAHAVCFCDFSGSRSCGSRFGVQTRGWPQCGIQVGLAGGSVPSIEQYAQEMCVDERMIKPLPGSKWGVMNHNSWMSLTFLLGLSTTLEGVFRKRCSDMSALWHIPRVHRADAHCQRECHISEGADFPAFSIVGTVIL